MHQLMPSLVALLLCRSKPEAIVLLWQFSAEACYAIFGAAFNPSANHQLHKLPHRTNTHRHRFLLLIAGILRLCCPHQHFLYKPVGSPKIVLDAFFTKSKKTRALVCAEFPFMQDMLLLMLYSCNCTETMYWNVACGIRLRLCPLSSPKPIVTL